MADGEAEKVQKRLNILQRLTMETDKWVSLMMLLKRQLKTEILKDFFLDTKSRLMEERNTECIRTHHNDQTRRKREREETNSRAEGQIDGNRQRRDVVRMKGRERDCEISQD